MNGKMIKWMTAGIVGILISITCIPAIQTAAQPETISNLQTEASILRMSVQIRLYVPSSSSLPENQPSSSGSPTYHLAQGLGTVANWRGETVILTHNHWGKALQEVECAQLLDAQGKLLLELSRDELNSLIRYHDPGTLVLQAPDGFTTVPAELAEEHSLAAGEVVTVVRQDPQNSKRVALLQAQVIQEKTYKGETVYQLDILGDDKIIPGDSGGGVWHEGKLIGNTWAAVSTPWPLSMVTPADTSLAAPLPLNYFEENVNAQDVVANQGPNTPQ